MKNILTLALAMLLTTSLYANDSKEVQTGLGVLHSSKIYKGTSSKSQMVPLITASYKDFYIEGLAIGYKLIEDESFTTSIELSSDFLGYKSSDSIYFSTLEDKKSTLNAILKNEYSLSKEFKLIGKLHYDISNKHNSYSVEMGVQYMLFQKKNHTLIGGLTLEYMNKKKSNYYYGVVPTQTNPYIYPYRAKEAFNSTLGLKYIYSYSDNWSFFSDTRTTLLDNSISNSPIVDTKYQHNFLVGVLYAW